MTGSNQKGFTLLELMISTTILAVVITVIVEAFWLGYRSWERGTDVMEHEIRLRTAIGLVSRQLRSTFPLVVVDEGGGGGGFYGDSQTISFVTTVPMGLERRGGLFRVEYFLDDGPARDPRAMMVSQRPVYAQDAFDTDAREDGLTVLPGLKEASWAYLKEGEWVDEWGDGDNTLPEKVRLTLNYKKEDREDVHETIIPILSWEKEAGYGGG